MTDYGDIWNVSDLTEFFLLFKCSQCIISNCFLTATPCFSLCLLCFFFNKWYLKSLKNILSALNKIIYIYPSEIHFFNSTPTVLVFDSFCTHKYVSFTESFIAFLSHWFSTLYLVGLHIVILSLLLSNVSLWQRVQLIYSLSLEMTIFIPCAAQGLDKRVHLVFYAILLLHLWEGHICINVHSSAKTTISPTQSETQWWKSFILSFNKCILISCGYLCTTWVGK